MDSSLYPNSDCRHCIILKLHDTNMFEEKTREQDNPIIRQCWSGKRCQRANTPLPNQIKGRTLHRNNGIHVTSLEAMVRKIWGNAPSVYRY
mmetsp:Transcript_26110/g.60024  ORF Transcript_26110/g.60024 Transcript_26110/m.60024 type:complete len:91 (-) Transcript_26110:530-802(-)